MSERDILCDLFGRLPTRDVAFGCRGASCAWRALIDGVPALQQRWQRRLQRLQLAAGNSGSGNSSSSSSSSSSSGADSSPVFVGDKRARPLALSPLDATLVLIKGVYLQWHREAIMRSYRRSFFESNNAGAALAALWQRKCVAAAPGTHEHALASAMHQFTQEAHAALEQRVLHDANDLIVERQCLQSVPTMSAADFDD